MASDYLLLFRFSILLKINLVSESFVDRLPATKSRCVEFYLILKLSPKCLSACEVTFRIWHQFFNSVSTKTQDIVKCVELGGGWLLGTASSPCQVSYCPQERKCQLWTLKKSCAIDLCKRESVCAFVCMF